MPRRTRPARRFALSLPLALLLAAPVAAQPPSPPGELTLERIMADPDWIGNAPEDAYWSDDSKAVYYEQKRQGSELRDLYRIDLPAASAESASPEKVADAERGSISVAEGEWSADRTKRVYVREGDVYVRDLRTGEVRQLTRTADEETDAEFLTGVGDGDGRVAYHRGGQVYVRDLASGLELQAADLRTEKDPEAEEAEAEADADYLERQQKRLFQVIRKDEAEDKAERNRERELQAADPTRPPLPFYLGDDIDVTGASISPSGRWMLVAVADADRDRGERSLMPEYVTESGYVETEKERPKVGTGDGKGESLLLLNLEAHEVHELDWKALPGIDVDPLAELRAAAEARREEREAEDGAVAGTSGKAAGGGTPEAAGGEEKEEKEDEGGADSEKGLRAVSVGQVVWNRAGDRAAVMVFSRDNKDRWIATVDFQGARLVPRERLTDPAWINWDFNEMGWLADGSTLWLLSEESGYSQLYLHALAGAGARAGAGGGDGGRRRATPGCSVVSSVTLSPDGRYLYYLDNQGDPAVYEVYRVPVAGGAPEKLTDLGGLNDYVLSPDGSGLLVTHSTATRLPDLWLQDARPGAAARRLTDTVSPAYAAVDWTEPRIVPVPSTHVKPPIWSRLYLPKGFDPHRAEPYPAVIFIHGAGYLQDAHAGWSYYFREHMFHTLLTRRGCLVLDMDYRGSAGYGRDWRTAIYRDMGHPELEDLEDGVAWLAATRDVDRRRVGVYGGSYGGFLTLMALFRDPGLFAAGAAIRPVTDWAHYNDPYTSDILNTPDVDPEAYERSSPIEYASGLSDPLIILHGMVDDNVFFQDTVRLAQRLIELGKQNWWVAFYPVESHDFQQPSSWLDAYRRIDRLFEELVLPAKPSGSIAVGGK
jgi:dipeptidyl aminopeptidase/acylaminoacyl peptidase